MLTAWDSANVCFRHLPGLQTASHSALLKPVACGNPHTSCDAVQLVHTIAFFAFEAWLLCSTDCCFRVGPRRAMRTTNAMCVASDLGGQMRQAQPPFRGWPWSNSFTTPYTDTIAGRKLIRGPFLPLHPARCCVN